MISSRQTRYGKAVVVVALAVLSAFAAAAAGSAGADKVPFPRPSSHRGDWPRNHGLHAQVDMNEAGQAGSACLTCHQKNDCIACHSQTMPKDHTNFWRTRGHGITASVNRERCQYCHRQDYCIRCHNETAPRSHTGAWQTKHCSSGCHFGPIPTGSCGVCHKRSPH